MAEVLLSAFLQVVMEKATDHVLEQFAVMWGTQEKLEKLERMLSAIQDILGDAEQRQFKEAGVKSWLAALKNAAYEADDILDEFKLEAMRRKAEIKVDMRKKVRSFFSFHNPALFRYKMGKKLEYIVEKIEEIANERNTFHFKVKTQPQNKTQTHSYVADVSGIIGREKEKEKIVKLLLNHDDNQNVAVLPIVGMGGLDKTTLAQFIYNDEMVEKHFQPRIWVCVSDEFNVEKLAREIIALATKTECQEPNMDALQRRLRDILSGKKYLLVLDDVWNEDRAKWDELKTLLETGGKGSRIIVTTRSRNVSSIMGTLDACHLDFLNEHDSWELFKKMAKPPQHLASIGKEIVKKCGGLPLAVKTLGSLMHSKSQKKEWSFVRDSEIWDIQVGEDGILPALRLSYGHLPSHLKQCFAFCAMFPKDYGMEKDLLIQLWIANGFIPSDGRKELEDKGHEIFNELASRSFFQDIKVLEDEEDEIFNELARRFYFWNINKAKEAREYPVPRHELYYTTTCKMHDLMHDLAQSIMGNECRSIVVKPTKLEDIFEKNDISRKTRHLHAYHNVGLHNYRNIRTLLSPTTNLSKPTSLRALGLYDSSFEWSQISVGFLKHLRYLDLSHTSIELLPDAISTLFNLQTLKLSKCLYLHKLPKNMRNMRNLRHLYIDRCANLKHLPADIGQLSNLQILTKYIVGNDARRRIGELNCLNLGGLLELYNLKNVRNAADAKEANLSSKYNLCTLILCWDMILWDAPDCYTRPVPYNCEDVLHIKNAEKVLEALTPHDGLKLLAIWRYGGGRFPTWMMHSLLLKNLVEIHLGVCTGCEHLPPLWQLPLLKFLYLIKMVSIKHICSSTIYDNASNGIVRAFPSLKRLVLHTMQSLQKWSEYEGTAAVTLVFPQLAELSIIGCPNLMTMPELPSLNSLKMEVTDKQLGLVRSLTTLSTLSIEVYKTSNGTESPPLAWKELSFSYVKALENLIISQASEDLARLLEVEEETRWLRTSLHHLEIELSDWLFSSSQQSSSPLGFWKNLTSLLSLRITCCDDLVNWPEEEFRCLNSLKQLSIRGCSKLVGTSRLPSSSSSSGDGELLPNLENLNIEYCDGLLELPKLPSSLKSLNVDTCSKLNSMTEGLRNATNLDRLSIERCRSLTCLPQGFGQLTALNSLSISNCSNLSSLPEGMEGLTVLTSIDLHHLPGLTCLPQGFGQLTALNSLSIGYCSNLSSLPEGMEGLTALRELTIVECPRLSSLPEGLQQRLPDLEHLDIEGCPNLERQYARGGRYWDLISGVPDTGTLLSKRRSTIHRVRPSISCFGIQSTV